MANLVGSGDALAVIITPYASDGSQAVIAGVEHEWGTTQSEVTLPSGLTTTTQHINVLRVDSDAPDIHFETALPFGRVNGRQRTTDQAIGESHSEHRVVGAINGDFWRTRRAGADSRSPINVNIRNGELIAAGPNTKNALGFRADGTPIIGQPITTMTLTLPGSDPMTLGGVTSMFTVRLTAGDV
jgi:hypothetical protein